MRKHEIEAWVLDIVERVQAQKQIEDSRVELKAEWPADNKRAARQLAGLSNAGRGQEVLWVIGLDEKRGVVGAEKKELSNWYAQVKTEFDGVCPEVEELAIPLDSGPIVIALLFDTSRAPFVVKKPDEGKILFEVPWREATGTRTVSRSDLIKILSPVAAIPTFEVLGGQLVVGRDPDPSLTGYYLGVDVYVYPKSKDTVVIPFHQTSIKVSVPKYLPETGLKLESMRPTQRRRDVFAGGVQPIGYFPPTESASRTIDSTDSELVIYGPGKFHLSAHAGIAQKIAGNPQIASASIIFGIAGIERQVPLNLDLAPTLAKEDELGRWAL